MTCRVGGNLSDVAGDSEHEKRRLAVTDLFVALSLLCMPVKAWMEAADQGHL